MQEIQLPACFGLQCRAESQLASILISDACKRAHLARVERSITLSLSLLPLLFLTRSLLVMADLGEIVEQT